MTQTRQLKKNKEILMRARGLRGFQPMYCFPEIGDDTSWQWAYRQTSTENHVCTV